VVKTQAIPDGNERARGQSQRQWVIVAGGDMPLGLKSNNAGVKAHRAKGIARRLMQQGVTRKQANVKAAAEVERDYARPQRGMLRRSKVDGHAHDAATGDRKVDLRTRRGSQASGASKIDSAATKPRSKRSAAHGVPRTGTGSARKPRTSSATQAVRNPDGRRSAAASRLPTPRKPGTRKRASSGVD
jgi:hypothetical protein